ncbi:hypothetical protein J18TS1_24070 [Oceanobacillus oncorhynchi subsp. incaldanensis]|uniref:Uncharacterized protein n=2 Tax=Oceanobacillus TaxID=182709 RepID=A0A0A1MSG6_9BACI|nr:hypothetical protein [Oceanobacillus oncorhynchi]MDM8102069.1 hypothetical protein [Oceanobacillus oncorhynchi]GIO19307.1 hypothetical protein J18TS1_24070 [Oceanobacillus oncorhynchi subsp. incaldanensis]CEI82629.1 hypothetical protein BN997_02512 [Oceanobacillus oncorhynchi]
MWDELTGILPNYLILLCTLLSFLVPYVIYKVNQKLHEYGDPPWKHSRYEENKNKKT